MGQILNGAPRTTKAGVQFNNDYCSVCQFAAEAIVEVRAYLDSVLVAKAVRVTSWDVPTGRSVRVLDG